MYTEHLMENERLEGGKNLGRTEAKDFCSIQRKVSLQRIRKQQVS